MLIIILLLINQVSIIIIIFVFLNYFFPTNFIETSTKTIIPSTDLMHAFKCNKYYENEVDNKYTMKIVGKFIVYLLSNSFSYQ